VTSRLVVIVPQPITLQRAQVHVIFLQEATFALLIYERITSFLSLSLPCLVRGRITNAQYLTEFSPIQHSKQLIKQLLSVNATILLLPL
jgi:hypothetical protein